MFWRLFYNIVIVPLGWVGFHAAGLFNAKVRRGIRGRKHLFDLLDDGVARLDPSSKRVWFHSSSMGEFEQAKPIIADLKRRYPGINIIVSFFSPSGYEHSKNYKLADVITYLPFDSHRNAEKFISVIKPSAAVMLRYDVWPNHLWAARRRGIPTFIASATLRSKTVQTVPFIHQFYAALYDDLDFILTVSENDRSIFASLKVKHPVLEVIGDTRYDQVLHRSEESKARHLLPEKVVGNRKILVVGSSWVEDEHELLPACYDLVAHHPDILVVLVPHEPTLEHVERLESELNGRASHLRFSEINDYRGETVIIVDSVGVLMQLYRYASAVFVGGSFGGGVHNVLEPAVYGIPIVVGPRYENSQEAVWFANEGAVLTVKDSKELSLQLRRLFEDKELRLRMGEKSRSLVRSNAGATERFLSYLEKVL